MPPQPYAICRRCRREFTQGEAAKFRRRLPEEPPRSQGDETSCNMFGCPMPDHNEEDGE